MIPMNGYGNNTNPGNGFNGGQGNGFNGNQGNGFNGNQGNGFNNGPMNNFGNMVSNPFMMSTPQMPAPQVPMPQQTMPQQPVPAPTMNMGFNWVSGAEGAKAWPMSPNTNALLMDSDNDDIFYIKMCDSIGMCKLRTFRYSEITDTVTTTSADMSQYVTREELNEILMSLQQQKKSGGKVNGKQSISATERTE